MQSEYSTPKVCSGCDRSLPLESFSRNARAKDGHRSDCKECQAKTARQYRQTHRKERAEYNRLYHEAHPEHGREYSRQWRRAHPEYHRRWQRENREACAEYVRRHHLTHRDSVAERKRLYKQNHPDVVRVWRRNRKARRKNALGTHTAADISAQIKRQKGRCFWCGERVVAHHVDHVTPLILGGGNGPENLVISCPTCNCRKGAKHPMEWAGVMC